MMATDELREVIDDVIADYDRQITEWCASMITRLLQDRRVSFNDLDRKPLIALTDKRDSARVIREQIAVYERTEAEREAERQAQWEAEAPARVEAQRLADEQRARAAEAARVAKHNEAARELVDGFRHRVTILQCEERGQGLPPGTRFNASVLAEHIAQLEALHEHDDTDARTMWHIEKELPKLEQWHAQLVESESAAVAVAPIVNKQPKPRTRRNEQRPA